MELNFSMEDFAKFQMFMQMYEQGNLSFIETPKKSRRQKGTGTVYNLGTGRKRPYRACITEGYDKWSGKQNQLTLGYFLRREDAEKALDIYLLEKEGRCEEGSTYSFCKEVNASIPKQSLIREAEEEEVVAPVQMVETPTLAEIYETLMREVWSKRSASTQSSYAYVYKHLASIEHMRISDIRFSQLQTMWGEVQAKKLSKATQTTLKSILSAIYKYAMKFDYVDKNYASFLVSEECRSIEKVESKMKDAFSEAQIRTLREYDADIRVKMVLVLIYTGLRPTELRELDRGNIHLEEGYLVGGTKTKAGKDRVVPIHSSVKPYIEDVLDFILGRSASYLRMKWQEAIELCAIEGNLTPHSGRHTFASLAKAYGMDDLARKRILGHATNDLTNDVYTHLETERLISEMKKIPSL